MATDSAIWRADSEREPRPLLLAALLLAPLPRELSELDPLARDPLARDAVDRLRPRVRELAAEPERVPEPERERDREPVERERGFACVASEPLAFTDLEACVADSARARPVRFDVERALVLLRFAGERLPPAPLLLARLACAEPDLLRDDVLPRPDPVAMTTNLPELPQPLQS